MSEQEIAQLASLLEKAKGTLTPIGKGGPEYITVNNGILIGHSMEFHNGTSTQYYWDTTSNDNDVVVVHNNHY